MRKPLISRRDRKLRQPRPLLSLVPNLFTALGLAAGMTAMRFALDDRWQLAAGLIVAAAVFDGLDGRSARMLNQQSKLGEQLDSLADFLSFGVAPAFIIYLWVLNDVQGLGWALTMLFALCSALRLARFNVEIDDGLPKPAWSANFFKGVPAPAAAGLAILPMILSFSFGDAFFRSWPLNAFMLALVGLLMVSTVPTFSIKKLRVPPNWVLPVLIGGVLLVVLLVTETWATFGVLGLVYLASLPVGYLTARRWQQAEEASGGYRSDEPAADDAPLAKDD